MERFSVYEIQSSRIIFALMTCCLYLHGATLSAQSIYLAWTPSNSPILSHYGVYRTQHPDSSFVLLQTVAHPDTTYIDDAVQVHTHYYYVATAIDLLGNESGFSNMVDTTISTTVAVELNSFSVQAVDNDAVIEWRTGTESGNYGFEIQRRMNTTAFHKIGFVKGQGTRAAQKNYRFVDFDLIAGTYYYRLKQLDLSGDDEFTNSIKISIGVPSKFRLEQNYPNPFNLETMISYSLPASSPVKLIIYNTSGQVIYRLVDEFQLAGRYTVAWRGLDNAGQKVASGIYYYKIETEYSAIFRKMTLLK